MPQDNIIAQEDVAQAVERGLLSESQAAQLRALAQHRQGLRSNLAADDEPFEFFRGMNEIFISIGLVLALSGAYALISFFTLILAWVLAEYFVRRRKMALPAIVLSCGYALSAMTVLVLIDHDASYETTGITTDYLLRCWGMVALSALFYWRFRVPFALVPVAASLLCAMVALIAYVVPDAAVMYDKDSFEAMFDASVAPSIALTTLLFGIICFAAAMHFDLKDPHRVTRYSACGFWLHMAAAPALVNMPAYTAYSMESAGGVLLLVLMIVVMTVVSLVIDRRSFLLSACTYVGLLLYKATEMVEKDAVPLSVTIMVVGGFMLVIGAKWSPLRRSLMKALPGFKLKDRLPPYELAS